MFSNQKSVRMSFFLEFLLHNKNADFSRFAVPVCQRVCAGEGVAARCAVRVSGGRYNIDPDCRFSNAFITI